MARSNVPWNKKVKTNKIYKFQNKKNRYKNIKKKIKQSKNLGILLRLEQNLILFSDKNQVFKIFSNMKSSG